MDLTENPFYVLGVGPRHRREEIVEAAEERSLRDDGRDYVKARSVLTHPRNRVNAETSWLPGLNPDQALLCVHQARQAPKLAADMLPHMSPLARCNLAAMIMARHRVLPLHQSSWMQFLARSYDAIDRNVLLNHLNQDREQAGFAVLPSTESIDQALDEVRGQYADTMVAQLDRATAPDELLIDVLNATTGSGRLPPPALVEELVHKYQVEVQKYLDQLADQIREVLRTLHEAPYVERDQKFQLIESRLAIWCGIARPLQLLMESKGMDHQPSIDLANEIRNEMLFLANDHQLHEPALQMSRVMSKRFSQLPMFSQSVQEDIKTLEGIIARKSDNSPDPQWVKEIELDMEIGVMSKDRLLINESGITFKGVTIPLEDVDRIRWGSFVQYINGIKSKSSHLICVASSKHRHTIECARAMVSASTAEANFKLIIDKLWSAVCVRLINQTLKRIANGEKIRYGTIVVSLEGILMEKSKFLTLEPYLASWDELSILNEPGQFVILSATQSGVKKRLSYRDVENVHILEAVMRFLWKDGNLKRLQNGEFK